MGRHKRVVWTVLLALTIIVEHKLVDGYGTQTGQQPVNNLSRQFSDNGHCALTLPQRENGCVTYDSINKAFHAASQRMKYPLGVRSKARAMTDIDIDHFGHVMLETTRILAREYNMPPDVTQAEMPSIDMRRTAINEHCPAYLKKPRCSLKRFREYNGMCNNLDQPHWGATLTPFRRLIPAAYGDGVSTPRISVTGRELPTARFVSAYNHRDFGYHDHAVTVFLPAWGQLIDHDMTMGAETKDPATDAEPVCCDKPPERRHPACWPIDIPPEDPFYSVFRRRCMEFVRSATGLKENCKLGDRSTMNGITSFLDASFIYGSSKETANKLRSFRGGLLKSNSELRHLGLKDLLPPKLENPDAGCPRPNKDTYCFTAGDGRLNQQMMLIAQHTVLMREHNRIAYELGRINPHWNDERIFQETRHIMAAVVQHITFNEFLPMVLGKDVMERYGLLLQKEGFGEFYNPGMDPTIPVAFFAAAFRFGHSLIPGAIERWSVSHQYVGARRLSEALLKPFDFYRGGTCDQYLSGFMNQVSQAVDDSMTQELTNHLFAAGSNPWGADLASLNLQRGRDNGVPSYNAFRAYCGLPRARHWDDLAGVFTNDTLQRYVQTYASVDDIDLWSAGISERPMPGSMVGPVFACIMGETFRNLRYGDRFWYENGGWPSSFTLGQLNEIRRVKLSRIVCDNSDHLESAQVYVMVLPDPKLNPRVPCRSSVLPRINLELWRDTGNHDGHYHDEHLNNHIEEDVGTDYEGPGPEYPPDGPIEHNPFAQDESPGFDHHPGPADQRPPYGPVDYPPAPELIEPPSSPPGPAYSTSVALNLNPPAYQPPLSPPHPPHPPTNHPPITQHPLPGPVPYDPVPEPENYRPPPRPRPPPYLYGNRNKHKHKLFHRLFFG